jgi:hypothetical protein
MGKILNFLLVKKKLDVQTGRAKKRIMDKA